MDTIDKIIQLLDERGKKQKELTSYIGVSEGVFSQWKARTSESYKQRIDKISEFLNVPADYLLKNGIKKDAIVKGDDINRDVILAMFDSLTPEQQKQAALAILDIVQSKDQK